MKYNVSPQQAPPKDAKWTTVCLNSKIHNDFHITFFPTLQFLLSGYIKGVCHNDIHILWWSDDPACSFIGLLYFAYALEYLVDALSFSWSFYKQQPQEQFWRIRRVSTRLVTWPNMYAGSGSHNLVYRWWTGVYMGIYFPTVASI